MSLIEPVYGASGKVIGWSHAGPPPRFPPQPGDPITTEALEWIVSEVPLEWIDRNKPVGVTRAQFVSWCICRLRGFRCAVRTEADEEAERLVAVAEVLQS